MRQQLADHAVALGWQTSQHIFAHPGAPSVERAMASPARPKMPRQTQHQSVQLDAFELAIVAALGR